MTPPNEVEPLHATKPSGRRVVSWIAHGLGVVITLLIIALRLAP